MGRKIPASLSGLKAEQAVEVKLLIYELFIWFTQDETDGVIESSLRVFLTVFAGLPQDLGLPTHAVMKRLGKR